MLIGKNLPLADFQASGRLEREVRVAKGKAHQPVATLQAANLARQRTRARASGRAASSSCDRNDSTAASAAPVVCIIASRFTDYIISTL